MLKAETVEGSDSVSIRLFYTEPAVYLQPPGFSISQGQKAAEQGSLVRLFFPAMILCPPASPAVILCPLTFHAVILGPPCNDNLSTCSS